MQLLQGVSYKAKQLLIGNRNVIKCKNTSFNTIYIVNITSFFPINYCVFERLDVSQTLQIIRTILLYSHQGKCIQLQPSLYSQLILLKSMKQIMLGGIHLCADG